MKKFGILLIGSLLYICSFAQQKHNVLFIGNSYTYVNDLPKTFADFALSIGDTIVYDLSAPGGYTFQQHTTNATTLQKIMQGNWDYVVLQEQSQLPSFPPSQVETACYPYATILDSLIKKYNPCAETVFYMTWGRKNGDQSNCANYPPLCTYSGMQDRLAFSYGEMAATNSATLAPVGEVWRSFRTNFPSIDLYQADESHPSVFGTYLAASTFAQLLLGKDIRNANYLLAGVDSLSAYQIRTTAYQIVTDSLSKWAATGDLPFANFSYLASQNIVQFTDKSINALSYRWSFGNGDTSVLSNPNYTYSQTGNYLVTLIVENNCKTDTFSQTIHIATVPNAINEIASKNYFIQNPFHEKLELINLDEIGNVTLVNTLGEILISKNNKESKLTFDTVNWDNGIYFIRLQSKDGRIFVVKIIRE